MLLKPAREVRTASVVVQGKNKGVIWLRTKERNDKPLLWGSEAVGKLSCAVNPRFVHLGDGSALIREFDAYGAHVNKGDALA